MRETEPKRKPIGEVTSWDIWRGLRVNDQRIWEWLKSEEREEQGWIKACFDFPVGGFRVRRGGEAVWDDFARLGTYEGAGYFPHLIFAPTKKVAFEFNLKRYCYGFLPVISPEAEECWFYEFSAKVLEESKSIFPYPLNIEMAKLRALCVLDVLPEQVRGKKVKIVGVGRFDAVAFTFQVPIGRRKVRTIVVERDGRAHLLGGSQGRKR